ncbi:MAG: dihydroorotase [Bacilli bacterium]|nr:dihydroorotase [Bacilli bacterium]
MLKIKNIHVIDPLNNRDEITDIYIDDNGCICNEGNVTEEVDGTGKIAYPGFVDIHVHFRDPGQTYKEDLYTGSNAAIAGGYSYVVCMANTVPVIDNVELYKDNSERMKDLPLNVYQAVAISKGFKGVELTDMDALKEAGVIFFTDDGLPLKDGNFVKEAMIKAKELNVPLSFHEEDPTYIGKAGVNEGKISKQLGFVGASRLAESEITKRDIKLAEQTGATINIQHISSKEAVELVRQAKKDGISIHAEACPHHFTLTEDAVLIHGSLAKMNPPLREEEDRIAICEGLKDGTIDIIATDHAPHSDEEKSKELMSCPSGILGLETAYALANEMLVEKGYLDDVTLIERMAINPGKLIGVRCALDIGKPANMVVVDPKATWIYKESVSKSNNSPFLNRKMIGKVVMTFAKGKCVYKKIC